MREINPSNQSISSILPRSHYKVKNREAKWSQFVVQVPVDEKKYFFNTLTMQALALSAKEAHAIQSLSLQEIHNLSDKMYSNLVNARFLVPATLDELAEYRSLIEVLGFLQPETEAGIKTYTILPTTACNARCFYCFEAGRKYVQMMPETADAVVKFILDSRIRSKKIKLCWFGGEPLMGIENIRKICGSLYDAGVEYSSEIVTNASLLTKEIAEEAVSSWNLSGAQVTLDGTEEEHNRRKAYVSTKGSPFKKSIQGIHYLLDAGVKVSIRINVDRNSIEEAYRLVDYLNHEFPERKGLTVYIYSLFGDLYVENGLPYYRELYKIRDYILQKGFKTTSAYRLDKMKMNYCMASEPGKSVVINADGKLYSCDDCMPGMDWGDLRSETFDYKKRDEMVHHVTVEVPCETCAFLPACTEYKGCPHAFKQCKDFRFARLEAQLRELLQNPQAIEDDMAGDEHDY